VNISVLLAEDSEIMRKRIADLLKSDPEIQIVAEAPSLDETMRLTSKLQPKIVIMDLHLGDENSFPPSQVRSCFMVSRLLAISLWTDEETKGLAKSFGAAVLLDKTKLGFELIPAIKRCAQDRYLAD
jgi:DNA-binding NarL/FixJ family response regulator